MRDRILDISVNLARVSEWILSENERKQSLVDQFLIETNNFVKDISKKNISSSFLPTLEQFKLEFEKLKKDRKQRDKKEWAERALTWANILQHRSSLI